MQTADNFDGCWKEALETYFPQFMQLFWPDIAAHIDWTRPHEFLDQELQKLVGNAETGVRRVDKLVKVWLRNGREQWLLIHVEIQDRVRPVFAPRMLTYNTRVRDRYAGRPLYSLVIVTHGSVPKPGRSRHHPRYRWRYHPRQAHPETLSRTSAQTSDSHGAYLHVDVPLPEGSALDAPPPDTLLPGFHELRYDSRNFAGQGLVFYFSVIHLREWQAHWPTLERIARQNPFALVIMAQLEAAASRDGDQRLASKTRVARLMYTYGYTKKSISQVFRLLDWMIRLPEALEPVFADEMRRIEAEDGMTYVTSIERVFEQRGQSQLLRRLLSRKFGPLPEWVETELSNANDEQLLLWADRVLDETSLQKVFER